MLEYVIQEPKIKTGKNLLLVMLHGYGSNELDLFSFAQDIPENFYIISFRAPLTLDFGGYAWYEINFMDAKKFNNIPQAKQAVSEIINSIMELSKTYSFDLTSIWLCGFSQGCILSYALALNSPELFKNIIGLSGYLDEEIVGKISSNEHLHRLNFYLSHGIQDAVIPIEWSRKAPELLKNRGISVNYHEYNSGHGLNAKNYNDMIDWIKQHNS
jgi:phospholipase/carboxylesterase